MSDIWRVSPENTRKCDRFSIDSVLGLALYANDFENHSHIGRIGDRGYRMFRTGRICGATGLALVLGSASVVSADEAAAPLLMAANAPLLERIVVVAKRGDADKLGGSAQLIGQEVIEKFSFTDVNRVLREAPGLNLQEEDGFGLRPNIGIRGSGNDRSAKIAIMEDGVPVAPAPYAAPAAYYFPQIGRMQGVEIVKGPAAIKYGPQTVAGALNFYSTAIPDTDRFSGKVDLLGGENKTLRAHAYGGQYFKTGGAVDVGILLETLQNRSDGFKKIDRGGDTGFEIQDYVGKLAFRTNEKASLQQSLELKIQHYKETSDETYLGLSLADFNASPYRRYNASQMDEMNVEHQTYQATHRIKFNDTFDLTTLAYYNKTKRAWYKLQDVHNGAGYVSMSNVLANPASFATAYQNLVGAAGYVSADNALRVRNNNREYYSWGVQSVLGINFDLGATTHDVELSVRYHADEEDRFQNQDAYRMDNGTMVRTTTGALGAQANRVVGANAWSFFVRDSITLGAWTVVPGVRYETINLKSTSYGPADPNRLAPTATVKDKVDVWIPGISSSYALNDNWLLLAGVHRGFASPAPGSGSSPEKSWNYEAGFRFQHESARFEAIGFYTDYENLLGTCTLSTGGGCVVGTQFDGGEVEVKGLEVMAGYNVALSSGFNLPLSAVYTYTDSKFKTSFNSNYEPWGTVVAGDELPHVPSHQLTFNVGLEAECWRINVAMNHVSKSRATAGRGAIAPGDKIDARTLFDVSAEYDVLPDVSLFVSAENLTDKVYNVAFSPAGARPGKPRTVLGGIKLAF